jgi:hypothetical protein
MLMSTGAEMPSGRVIHLPAAFPITMLSESRSRHIAMAAHVADEAAAGFDMPVNALHDSGRVRHPVQRRISEDRIEALGQIQVLFVHVARVDPELGSGLDHDQGSVDSDDPGPEPLDLVSQDAIATAEVEDRLSWLRVEQSDERASQIRNEARMMRVVFSIPVLLTLRRHPQVLSFA